jgi:nucleoside-diphosphate-sugar epimerase
MSRASTSRPAFSKVPESLFSKKKVLVTGGAGFIGSHLVRRLHTLNAETVVVDPFPVGIALDSQVRETVQFITLFLGEYISHPSTDLSAFEFVFHLAGNALPVLSVEKPAMDFEQNVVSTFRLLDALRTASKPPVLINMSSAAVYGNPAAIPVREGDLTIPLSPYGVSKLTGERYATVFSSLYNLRTVNVRPFSVYGPGLRKQVVYDTLKKLRNDPTRLEMFGDGQQLRDFIYVSDLVDALLLIATKAPAQGEAYNVASGTSKTISEVVDAICWQQKVMPIRCYSGKTRLGEPERWEVNTERLNSLGFSAKVTLEDGLRETGEWFKNQTHV